MPTVLLAMLMAAGPSASGGVSPISRPGRRPVPGLAVAISRAHLAGDMAGRRSAASGPAKRITDFFGTKRLAVAAPAAVEEESVLLRACDADHPFFQAQAKRVKEAEEARAHPVVPEWQAWRTGGSDAPSHPPANFVLCQGRIFEGEDGPDRQLQWRSRQRPAEEAIATAALDLDRWDDTREETLTEEEKDHQDALQLFREKLEEILTWMRPGLPSKVDAFTDPGEAGDGIFPACLGAHHSAAVAFARRPIVFLSGPSAVGKSRMAQALADSLGVPLTIIDGAVSNRSGRPFDDVLGTSHGQRRVMRQFLAPPLVEGIASAPELVFPIRLVVLVDEVDLVFETDRFYGPLNAFLRNAPRSILVLLTSNTDLAIMGRFIDLPPGSLATTMAGGRRGVGAPPEVVRCSAATAAREQRSLRGGLIEYDPAVLPLYCWPYDAHEDAMLPPSGDQQQLTLMIEVQREGWMLGCRGSREWSTEYRPAWRALEEAAARQHKARSRRTIRALSVRPYLLGVPASFIQRLRGPDSKERSACK